VGYIQNYADNIDGPAFNPGDPGYTPLFYQPLDSGEYVIEFNPDFSDDPRLILRYFDVTVTDSTDEIKLGRLHSKNWQVSTGCFSCPINSSVYPYHPNGVVYEVDFNELIPFVFTINFNSTGTDSTGNFLNDRISRVGNHSIPEFEVFLNPPEEELFPSLKRDVAFNANIIASSCDSTIICLDVTSSLDARGVVDGFLDFNNNLIFEPEQGDISFVDIVDSTGQTCFTWDGRDANGNRVGRNKLNLVSSFGSGITHLPLYDIEHNRNGYKVTILKPNNLPDPTIFWDDSEITDGSPVGGSPLVNLRGCNSSNNNGCHAWENRGSLFGQGRDRQETINTWWFSEMRFDTVAFDFIPNIPVQASFDPDSLIKDRADVCIGDTIDFFVLNNGENHYDTTVYDYIWTENGGNGDTLIAEGNRLPLMLEGNTDLLLTSIFKRNRSCISSDIIDIDVVNPIVADLVIENLQCVENFADVTIAFLSDQDNPQIYWEDDLSLRDLQRSDLPPGDYSFTIIDSTYSERCSFDSSFTIEENILIEIDQTIEDSTICYDSNGSIGLTMINPERSYEYSWEGAPFDTVSTLSNLFADSYRVVVRDSITLCETDTIIPVYPLPFSIEVSSKDEICFNNKGSVEVDIPDDRLSIIWDINNDERPIVDDLGSNEYNVLVFFEPVENCSTTDKVTVGNIDREVTFGDIDINPVNCFSNNGAIVSVGVVPLNDASGYLISWDDEDFGTEFVREGLGNSNYVITLQEEGTTCVNDTIITLEIPDDSFSIESTNTVCESSNGTVELVTNNPQLSVFWHDNPDITTFSRQNLEGGNYPLTLVHPLFSACNFDTIVTIEKSQIDLGADFSYKVNGANSPIEIEIEQEVEFFNESEIQTNVTQWTFGDGGTSLQNDPKYIYNTRGIYEITLFIENDIGCKDTAKKVLRVTTEVNCGLAMADTFTPNNDDFNDDIGPFGTAEELELVIFNRWGEAIYRSRKLGERWDGTYNYENSPIGVYPYQLSYTCYDIEGNEDRHTEIGEITLVR